MAGRTRELTVFISGDAADAMREFDRVNKATSGMGTAAASTGDKMKAVGSTMTRTVTPVAAAMAVGFAKAFSEFDTGADALRAETGKTGEALDGLVASMKAVAGGVTQPLSEVGKVMAAVQSRTDLMGEPLEALTKQILQLSKVTGTDAASNVESLTRAMGDAGVPADKMAGAIDEVFRASQASGVPVARLSELMVTAGAPLRGLGFDFSSSAALMAKFEKEGVNTELVLGGMKRALATMAKAGEDPIDTFKRVTKEIKALGPGAAQTQKAMELFGMKAGPDMADAINSGRFEIDSYLEAVEDGTDTVAKAARDTEDYGDKFAMLKNRVQGVIGPFGEVGSVIMGGVAAIGPMLMGLGALANSQRVAAVASRALSLAMTALPFVAIVAAVVLLAVVIVKNWDTIKRVTLAVFGAVGRFFTAAFDKIKGAVGAVLGWVRTNWPLLLAILTGPIGLAVLAIVKNFDKIKGAAGKVLGWIGDMPAKILGFFSGIGGKMLDIGRSIIEGIAEGIRAAARFLFNKIPSVLKRFIPDPIKKFFGIASPSKMAMGWGASIAEGMVVGMTKATGRVAGASRALAGAAALDGSGLRAGPVASPASVAALAGAGGAGITINLNGAVLGDVPRVVDQIRRELLRTKTRNGSTGL